MDMEEYCEIIWKILAAILMLGEIRFVEGSNGEAELDSNETANRGKPSKIHTEKKSLEYPRSKMLFQIFSL